MIGRVGYLTFISIQTNQLVTNVMCDIYQSLCHSYIRYYIYIGISKIKGCLSSNRLEISDRYSSNRFISIGFSSQWEHKKDSHAYWVKLIIFLTTSILIVTWWHINNLRIWVVWSRSSHYQNQRSGLLLIINKCSQWIMNEIQWKHLSVSSNDASNHCMHKTSGHFARHKCAKVSNFCEYIHCLKAWYCFSSMANTSPKLNGINQ